SHDPVALRRLAEQSISALIDSCFCLSGKRSNHAHSSKFRFDATLNHVAHGTPS
ncbi:unnamed protein product, partial [Ascophyllum nodosum]